MPTIIPDVVGTLAACCSTFAFLPQAVRVWRTKEVDQLSLPTFMLMVSGALLWLSYGIFKMDFIIIGANGVAFLFVSYIALMRITIARKATQNDESNP